MAFNHPDFLAITYYGDTYHNFCIYAHHQKTANRPLDPIMRMLTNLLVLASRPVPAVSLFLSRLRLPLDQFLILYPQSDATYNP
jgi:hypothetical protein